MKTAMNINKLLKLLMIILSVVFMATACSYNDTENQGNAFCESNATCQSNSDETLKQYSDEQATCWQTGVIDILYDQMGKVALGSYVKMTNGALPMMMIAFAVWLSFRLIKHVSSFTEENMAEVWTEILKKLFICIVCGMLASSTDNLLFVLNSIIFPLYNAFLEFGSQILGKANEGKSGGTLTLLGEEITLGKKVICTVSQITTAPNLVSFPESPKEMMDCMVCAVNERMKLGYYLSFKALQAPGFMAKVIGLFVMGCFFIVRLGFVFYLIDTIFKMSIMMVLLPILIMSYAFEQTKKWVSFAFFTILNSAAFMMFIAIMMAMALLAMEQVIRDNSDIFVQHEDLKDFKEFSIPFMCLMMIGFLIVSSINIAQEVSQSLVGGSANAEFQKKLKGVIQMVGGWIKRKIPNPIGKIAAVREAKEKVANIKNKLNSWAGRN